MRVIFELTRMGGVATRGELAEATSRSEVDAAVRAGAVVRVARGRYALPHLDDACVVAHRHSAPLCLLSAALFWEWPVRMVPPVPQIAVPRGRKLVEPSAAEAEVHRLRLAPGDVDGVATSRERTLADCMRLLPFADALAVVDSALREGFSRSRLDAVASGLRGPGAVAGRQVAVAGDGRSANPFESSLRAIALRVPGLRVVPQVDIRTTAGLGGSTWLGRPDLVDERLRVVIEADSFEWHGGRAALRRDAQRYNAFVADGWLVIRFAWEDVMHDPAYVEQVLRDLVAERTNALCPACRTAS